MPVNLLHMDSASPSCVYVFNNLHKKYIYMNGWQLGCESLCTNVLLCL